MLAECEPEPGSPGGAEEVGTLDAERVEDRDGVRDPGSQREALASCGLSLPPWPRWSAKIIRNSPLNALARPDDFATSSGSAKPV